MTTDAIATLTATINEIIVPDLAQDRTMIAVIAVVKAPQTTIDHAHQGVTVIAHGIETPATVDQRIQVVLVVAVVVGAVLRATTNINGKKRSMLVTYHMMLDGQS